MTKALKLAVLVLAIPAIAQAAIVGTSLGTAAPPGSLGGFTMQSFALDGQPLFVNVGSVAGPTGPISLTPALDHRQIGLGWATWSHGYAGDVYYQPNGGSSTVGLPAGTKAFILYAEPDPFAIFDISATANDGTTITQSVDGSGGAKGYGFHVTGGSSLTSVTVSLPGTAYAIGEFSIGVPEPTTMSLLGLVGAALLRRRTR
ncbi:MAG: PEP-CTERM sorting domain-containing protein [Phycisphaerae bacterium]